MPLPRDADNHQRPLLRHCLMLLALLVAANFLIVVVQLGSGRSLKETVAGTGSLAIRQLPKPNADDSWGAMANAYMEAKQGGDIYSTVLVSGPRNDIKFQYPPTTLLMLEALPEGTVVGEQSIFPGTPFNRVVSWLSRIAVLATVAAAASILLLVGRSTYGVEALRSRGVAAAAVFAAACLAYYPLFYAHQLGQIQVYLNLFLVLSLLAWVKGAHATAGLLVGACFLFKPQYGLIVVWAVLARHWRFAIPMILMAVFGLVSSLAIYGVGPNLRYLDVLQFLSRHGEVYWPNQSMNGVMNRLLGTGSPSLWGGFPQYSPIVHALTLISSVAIVLAALSTCLRKEDWAAGSGPAHRRVHAFGAMLAAATLASPIAWEHHYGFFLGLFAVLLPGLATQPRRSRLLVSLLLASFVAMACALKVPELLFANSLTTLLSSHLYFGALAVFGLLLYMDRSTTTSSPAG